jgi:hypothetical protein
MKNHDTLKFSGVQLKDMRVKNNGHTIELEYAEGMKHSQVRQSNDDRPLARRCLYLVVLSMVSIVTMAMIAASTFSCSYTFTGAPRTLRDPSTT